MKILILSDGLNWIVDRISKHIAASIPEHDIKVDYYTQISTNDLIKYSHEYDLIHYNNWDMSYHLNSLHSIRKPLLYTVRSFRYPEYTHKVAQYATKTLVIHPWLTRLFERTEYIPDGIFDEFRSNKKFRVGYAGRPDKYKGYDLIEQACKELGDGVIFDPAFDLPFWNMPDYFRSLDLYVCASQAEGHSTPVMECLAMNVPVITLSVGIPSWLNCHFIEERSVAGIKNAILRFYTAPQVLPEYSWERIIPQIKKLYESCV